MLKNTLPIILSVVCCCSAAAQNVGIGTASPYSPLEVVGDFTAHAVTQTSNAAPAAGQTYVLVNSNSISIPATDSVARIFDPGGQAGNYGANINAIAGMTDDGICLGYEMRIESINLGTGDSLVVSCCNSTSPVRLLAIGNNYTTPGTYVFSAVAISIGFKSNGDASTGQGFSILVKRIYQKAVTSQQGSALLSKSFYFNSAKGAFSSGRSFPKDSAGLYSASIGASLATGEYAFAVGSGAFAAGERSVAIGSSAVANGSNALALGYLSEASGNVSVAIGLQAQAREDYAIAFGAQASSSGEYSVAVGHDATASGDYSMALGYHVSTRNEEGALVIGDNSTTTVMNAASPNSFRARFAGGYRFYTSSNLTTNALLSAGSNAWSTSSDKRLKENFLELDGEDFLQKIAAMKLTSWNYKTQDALKFRHYGPMAQDFYAAFGNDGIGTIGNDTTINQADFDGVNLVAIQALVKRTEEQQKEINHYKEALEILRKEVEALKRKKP
jgi:hypothetical protein